MYLKSSQEQLSKKREAAIFHVRWFGELALFTGAQAGTEIWEFFLFLVYCENSIMESELKCPKCSKLYTYPVLLHCSHNLCFACAQAVQTRALKSTDDDASGSGSGPGSSSGTELDTQELDKLSLISEADSGVVCNSRPNSYIGTPSICNLPGLVNNLCWKITCPVCNNITNLDEQGATSLPKNRALENIVDKYGESKHYNIYCQMCEKNCNTATIMCEQCQVFYCDSCRETCHPDRGPLAEHKLVSPEEGKAALKAKNSATEPKCQDHVDESLSMYCVICKYTVCYLCVQDGHMNHEVQALGAMCKSQKVSFVCIIITMQYKFNCIQV